MSTVVIEQAKLEIDLNQLIRVIQSLDDEERQVVREALDRDWMHELDDILTQVHARFEAAPMSDAEIDTEIEAARSESHARRH